MHVDRGPELKRRESKGEGDFASSVYYVEQRIKVSPNNTGPEEAQNSSVCNLNIHNS